MNHPRPTKSVDSAAADVGLVERNAGTQCWQITHWMQRDLPFASTFFRLTETRGDWVAPLG
jgi:hypothetical protein